MAGLDKSKPLMCRNLNYWDLRTRPGEGRVCESITAPRDLLLNHDLRLLLPVGHLMVARSHAGDMVGLFRFPF